MKAHNEWLFCFALPYDRFLSTTQRNALFTSLRNECCAKAYRRGIQYTNISMHVRRASASSVCVCVHPHENAVQLQSCATRHSANGRSWAAMKLHSLCADMYTRRTTMPKTTVDTAPPMKPSHVFFGATVRKKHRCIQTFTFKNCSQNDIRSFP